MKTHLSLLTLLPAMALTLPPVLSMAAVPAAAAEADAADTVGTELMLPSANDDNAGEGTITITFTEPMVTPEQVGTAAPADILRISGSSNDLKPTAEWVSTSMVQVHLNDRPAPMDIAEIAVNTDGLRSLAGHAVQPARAYLPGHDYIYIHNSWGHIGEPVFFSAGDERYDAALAEAIHSAYYERTRYDKEAQTVRVLGRTPAKVRPATVADALQYWDAYVAATDWNSVDESDRKAFETMDGSTPLPYIWLAEEPTAPEHGESVTLKLPQFGEFDKEKKCYDEQSIASYDLPGFEYMLSNERVGVGEYVVKVTFTQPISTADAEEALRDMPFNILTLREGETPVPMTLAEDGTYHGETKYSRVDITPMITETLASKATQKVGAKTLEGCGQLLFRAKVQGERVRLSMNRSFTSMPGDMITAEDLKEYSKRDLDYTVLAPKRPYLHADAKLNSMEQSRDCLLRCEYRSLLDTKIHICRVEADSPQAALLLGNYLEKYAPAAFDESYRCMHAEPDNDKELSALPQEVWRMLPHREKTIDLNAPEGKTEIDLKALFGEETQGVFFVDARGTTHPEWQKDGKMVNQGLVQVTNLGLMWKVSGKSLFAYAYHLSDGKPVSTAKLRMLDKEARTIGELELKDGVVTTALPDNLTYLQVVEGKDCYTTTAKARNSDITADRWYYYYSDDDDRIPADLLPRPKIFLFTDRNLYRPGETIHLKGMVRFITGNEVTNPGLSAVTLTISAFNTEEEIEVKPDADGSFTADIPAKAAGYYSITAEVKVKGDDDESSPDLAMLRAKQIDREGSAWNNAKWNRRESIGVEVSDFRRNAFEVESELNIAADGHSVTINTKAENFTGAPVSHAKTEWWLHVNESNFYPEAFSDYYFGDYTGEDARVAYYDYYYGNGFVGTTHSDSHSLTGALDENGCGSCTMPLRSSEFPSPMEVHTYSSVTDGNEQTLKSHDTAVWHPCAVYAGISRAESLVAKGKPLDLKALVVTNEGTLYTGNPLPAKLKVTRQEVHNYRYGAKARTNVHSSSEWVPVEERNITLTGKPQAFSVPTTEAGTYRIEVEGTDPNGKPFRTAVTRYVWGGGESPWSVESGTDMSLITSSETYMPGDTAKVLVQTPVDGEVLVTVERGGVLRHFRRSITVDNPVVEVPLTEEDAPTVYVSAFLVQTGEKNRTESGTPLQKLGTTTLHVLPVKNKLEVALDVPEETQRPGKDCTVGGTVKDFSGKPVANASVTLFAEDEGTLQVLGYRMPDPMDAFMAEREHGVTSYSSLNQLLGTDLAKRDFGNKGVFIGGGGDEDEAADPGAVREDFAPCALWLANVKTDAQGRFTATFKNPDTLTRYRLMAVTAAGENQFGNGKATYKVDNPVRVEPSAPLSATEGDELLLPATVSMNVNEIPAADASLTWNLNLSGTGNVILPQPNTTVTLAGAAPKTLLQPVTLPRAGETRLTWRVQGTGALADVTDAAAFSFTVRPPMPFLREAVCAAIEPGKSAGLGNWLKGNFAKDTEVELTFSTSPLCGAADGLRYLITYPHGCVEQLSSALLPWLFKSEFETAVGLRYPQKREAAAIINETLEKIRSRRLNNGFFAYWQGGNANRNFTPYAALVLQLSGESRYALNPTVRALKKELTTAKDANFVGLYFLALAGQLDTATFDTARLIHLKPCESELWMLALCAEMIHHPAATELMQQARKAKGTGGFRYGLPSAMAAETLWAIQKAPNSTATAKQLRLYVESVAQAHPTTWECGWMCIAMHQYLTHAQTADKRATLNGRPVTMANPLRLPATVGKAAAYKAEGAPVYVSGTVEGYQATKQPEKMVDKGFAVTRRYEKLNPDGTWTATGTFQVGDVVRVTLTAKHTDSAPAVYMVLEDRLPAAFEAVNPDLTTQGLPDCIVQNSEQYWGGSAFINHREYLKDCVRLYATSWGKGDMNASYIARVVKSGKVTAPAAKAELMYRPQVYGLAIPQHFTVKPR